MNQDEDLDYMINLLIDNNPSLSGEQVREYARCIIEAERREDYPLRLAVIQEASSGPGGAKQE